MAVVKKTDSLGRTYYMDKNTGKRTTFLKYKMSVIKRKDKGKIYIKKH